MSIDTVHEGMVEKASDKTCPGSMALLSRLARVAFRLSTEELLGMRFKHFMAMCYLRDHDGAGQQELGEAMLLDPNNMVILLNQMEDAGLIERRRDVEDRRRHIVSVTPKGWKALEKAEKAQDNVEDDVLAALNQKERRDLWRLLNQALEGEGAPDEEVAAAKARAKTRAKAAA